MESWRSFNLNLDNIEGERESMKRAIELPIMNPQSSLDIALKQLTPLLIRHEVNLREKKRSSLPIIINYIQSSQNLNDLIESFRRLNWDAHFEFLKYRRYPTIDALFNDNQRNGTWNAIAQTFIEKLSKFILSKTINLNDPSQYKDCIEFCALVANKLIRKTLPQQIPSCLKLLNAILKADYHDKSFQEVSHFYQNHHLSQSSLLGLQNIHLLGEEFPLKDPLLDQLRYILVISFHHRLSNEKASSQALIYHTFHRIKRCIQKTSNENELKAVMAYLNQDGFDYLGAKNRKHLNAIANEHFLQLQPNAKQVDFSKSEESTLQAKLSSTLKISRP